MEWMVYGLLVLGVVGGGLAIFERRKGIKLRDDRVHEPQTEADRTLERIKNDSYHYH